MWQISIQQHQQAAPRIYLKFYTKFNSKIVMEENYIEKIKENYMLRIKQLSKEKKSKLVRKEM